jgi:hypothetical protein
MNIRASSTFALGDFSRVEALIVPKLQAGVFDAANIVLEESRNLVPVDTGELASSGGFTVEWKGQQVVGNVEYSAGHAAYNEFGTGQRGAASGNGGPGIEYDPNWPGMTGTPFLRPSLDSTRQEVVDAIKAALD